MDQLNQKKLQILIKEKTNADVSPSQINFKR